MPSLSAVIIVKNEEANIGECLDSVAFADERIVLDSGSTDNTLSIAQGRGAHVEQREWSGFGRQKNAALALATGDWILSIDADERVSPELRDEIVRALASGQADAYEMPRLSKFCGRPMRHSGWYPDYVLRLFRRGYGRFTDDLVHERVVTEGRIGRLRHPLWHAPVLCLEDALSRMDRYSTAGAAMLVTANRRVGFTTAIWHGLAAFLRTYVLRVGFLDGREGFLLAVANAEGTYYRYMKAWLATRVR